MLYSLNTGSGKCHSEATNGYVPPGCHGDGVPGNEESCTQRLGCKELHVSLTIRCGARDRLGISVEAV